MTAGPYRTNTVGVVVEAPPKPKYAASAVPLAIIAVTFFLPFTSDCSNRVIAPYDECRDFVGAMLIGAPFFAAAMLGASIGHTILTKRYARWLTLAAGAVSTASIAIPSVAKAAGGKVPALFLCAPSVTIFVFACKRRGWRQIELVLDGFVVSSLPLAALACSTAERYGAFVFIAAFGTLCAMRGSALVARIRARR